MAFTKNFKIIYIIKLSTTELFGINSQMPDEFAGQKRLHTELIKFSQNLQGFKGGV